MYKKNSLVLYKTIFIYSLMLLDIAYYILNFKLLFIYVYHLIIYETNNISLQKLDPAQFVRAYGRPCKINLDPAVAYAAESPQSMSVLA